MSGVAALPSGICHDTNIGGHNFIEKNSQWGQDTLA